MGIRYIWSKKERVYDPYLSRDLDPTPIKNYNTGGGYNFHYMVGMKTMPTFDSSEGERSWRYFKYTGDYYIGSSATTIPSQTYPYMCPINGDTRDDTVVNKRISYGFDRYMSTGEKNGTIKLDPGVGYVAEGMCIYQAYRNASNYVWGLSEVSTSEGYTQYSLGPNNGYDDDGRGSIYKVNGEYRQSPGSFIAYVSSASASAYPNYGVSGGYYYIAETQDNIDPTKVTIPDFISFGDTITITVTPSEDAVASSYGSISYRYEYSTNNGGSWQLINTTTSTTQQFTVPEDATRLKVRVRSSDNIGYTSADYVESKEVTISAAGSLAISGEDKDLGTITSGIDFYVSSEDVTEALVTISTGGYSWKFTAQVGQTYTIDIFDLVNGSNTVAITATAEVVSGTLTATRTYQYAKAVQEFETGDAYTINQNGSVFYPLLVAEGVKLSDGRTLDVALSSIMERLKQIEQQAS